MQLKTNRNRRILEYHDRFQGTPIGHGTEAVLSATDNARDAQHASFIRARELVLEVSRNHVADLSERVRYLFLRLGCVPQHALGKLTGGFAVAAYRQNAAQGPG